MVKLRNFLLQKVYNIFKDHCYEMVRLQSVQGKNRLRNVHTKSSNYQMFRIQNVQVTKCYVTK